MSYYNNPWSGEVTPAPAARVSVQTVLQRVYLWMALGALVTAGVAFLTVTNPVLNALARNPIVLFGAIIGELVLVLVLSAALRRLSPAAAATMFFVYAGLNGFTLSIVLAYFEVGSIVSAFVATGALFGAMTIVGFTTQLDLTRFGTYLMMGLIGLLIAMVVNLFLGSGGLDLIISIVGVLIFTALTAYDTQKIKHIAADPSIQADGSIAMKLSLIGALTLYLDFINLFLFLLRLMGGGSRD